VAVPVVGYAVAGERLDEPLARLKDWLDRHNAALVAVILVLIGYSCSTRAVTGWHEPRGTARPSAVN
jgi:Sap, sulfolipid-1-addressing protein